MISWPVALGHSFGPWYGLLSSQKHAAERTLTLWPGGERQRRGMPPGTHDLSLGPTSWRSPLSPPRHLPGLSLQGHSGSSCRTREAHHIVLFVKNSSFVEIWLTYYKIRPFKVIFSLSVLYVSFFMVV